MLRQLPADCLNEIFEYLEEDKVTLRSCLLVNRLHCEIAVRILWRNVWDFKYYAHHKPYYQTHIPLAIISTLIACLPSESKELLRKNGIIVVTPTSKPPLFNYASFCKVLLIPRINQMIQHVLEKQPALRSLRSLKYNKYLLLQEIFKMYMNQISSLKSLDFDSVYLSDVQNIIFVYFPGAKNCLTDLTELSCNSDIYPEFFFQISQICHYIQSLTIDFKDVISDGLADLISLQNNLTSLTLRSFDRDGTEIITPTLISLTKFSLTLKKLKITEYYIPLSFISIFTNLQELILSFYFNDAFDDFDKLQYVTFPQLKVLMFLYEIPKVGMLIKFLETNGKTLTKFYVGEYDNSLNLAIAKFCPNLKTLSTIFMKKELGTLGTLKIILNSCQYLENIRIWWSNELLNDKEFLEIFAKYLPKNFNGLELYCDEPSELICEKLEEFLINWKNLMPQISLLLIFTYYISSEDISFEIKLMIEKYMKMGVVKKFITGKYGFVCDLTLLFPVY